MSDPFVVGPRAGMPGAVDVNLGDDAVQADGTVGTVIPTTIEDAIASGLISPLDQRFAPTPPVQENAPPADDPIFQGGDLPPGANIVERPPVERPPARAPVAQAPAAAPEQAREIRPLTGQAAAEGAARLASARAAAAPPPFDPSQDLFPPSEAGALEAQFSTGLPPAASGAVATDPSSRIDQFASMSAGDRQGQLARMRAEQAAPDVTEVSFAPEEGTAIAGSPRQPKVPPGAATTGAAGAGAVPRRRGRGAGGGRLGRAAGLQQRIGETFDAEMEAVDDAANAIAFGSVRRGELMRNAEIAETQMQAQREAAERGRQEETDRQERAMSDARQALSTRKIEPNEFWRTRGEEARIGGALAVAVGQFISNQFGGRNAAFDIINQAVERNIAAQRDQLGRDERLLGFQERDLRRLYERFGDARVQEAASRALHWEAVDRQLGTLAAGVTDARSIAGLEQTQAQIARHRGEADLAFMREQQRMAARNAALRARQQAAVDERADLAMRTFSTSLGNIVLQLDNPEVLAAQVAQLREMNLSPFDQMRLSQAQVGALSTEEAPLPSPGGTAIVNPALWASQTPELRRQATSVAGSAADILSALDDAIALRQEHGAEFVDSAVTARAESIQQRLIADARSIRLLGTPQQSELAQLAEEFPVATSVGDVEGFVRAGGAFGALLGPTPLAPVVGALAGSSVFAGGGDVAGQDLVMNQLMASREQFRERARQILGSQGLDVSPEITQEPQAGPGGFQRADGL